VLSKKLDNEKDLLRIETMTLIYERIKIGATVTGIPLYCIHVKGNKNNFSDVD